MKIKHHCIGIKEGDWIVYKCSVCNYEMRENQHTDEMITRNSDSDILHSGLYDPFNFVEAFENVN